MFCGNCGSRTIAGDRFCGTCGRAHRWLSASQSAAVSVLLEDSKTPSRDPIAGKVVGDSPSTDQNASYVVPAAMPGERPPSYCRHSHSERTLLRVDRQSGSETCLVCKLPYYPSEARNPAPGPLAPAATHSGVRDSVDALDSSPAADPMPLITNLIALSVVAVMAVVLNTAPPDTPRTDPARALHRLKDIAKIDLPIDDAAVDTSTTLVPASLPRLPSAVGEYIGAASMASGDTIELRVSAYTSAADAKAFASWWNTSGAKEYLDGSTAVQCGRIVVDGAWVARHTQQDTIKLLHQAYPDCTPYIP